MRKPALKWQTPALILGYALLAVIFTWPLVLRIDEAYPSVLVWRGGDPNIFIWWIDWLAKAVTGNTPFPPSRMLYYPVGINPFAGYDGVLIGLVGMPLRLLTGNAVIAYNLIVLAAFPASAAAAYALVRHLSRSRTAAAFAGFMFGFSPYMLIRAAQHLNLALTFVIPLMVLAFLRFIERPSPRRIAAFAGSVFLTGLCSLYYLFFTGIFLAVGAVYFRKELLRAGKMTLAAAAAVLIAAILPVAPMLASSGTVKGTHPFLTIDFVQQRAAEPLNLLLPHPLTNVFGGITTPAYAGLIPAIDDGTNIIIEGTSYLGVILLLAAIALFMQRKKTAIPMTGLWISTAAVFFILAMGIYVEFGRHFMLLPFGLVWDRPPFSLIRSPNRFFVFTLLAATVLASFAVREFHQRLRGSWRAAALGLLAAALAAERLIFPYPLYHVRVSPFYKEIARDPEVYALAELPTIYPGSSDFNFYQTVHGKPIVNGEFFYTAYDAGRTFDFIKKNPLLSASVCRLNQPAALPNMERSIDELRRAGFRYVIIHNLVLLNNPSCPFLKEYLHRAFAGRPIHFTDGEITVYRL